MTDEQSQPQQTPVPESSSVQNAGWRLRNELFRETTVQDQAKYYNNTAKRNRIAATQVNQIRALLSLSTGLAAGLAALLVNLSVSNTTWLQNVLAVLAVGLPAVAAAFNTLADLYQWDRTRRIYDTSERTLKYAESYEPHPSEDINDYREKQKKYAEITLKIMRDEQAQWGLSIRVPKQTEDFMKQQASKIAEQEEEIKKLKLRRP